jgi:NitT/TauT family transport system permease protein
VTPPPAAAPARRRSQVYPGFGRPVLLPVIGTISSLLAWWLAVRLGRIPPYVIPSPQAVLAALGREASYLTTNAWTTLIEILGGFLLTVVGGVLVGTLLSLARWVEQALSPVLVALNAVPKLAFAPMLLVWMGYGHTPKIFMVVLVSYFPVVLTTVSGLTSTPAELVELSRALCGSRWKVFTRIRLPAALPQMFIGFKTGMPLAVIGAVIAELFAANEGLGFVIQGSTGDLPLAFAAIAVLAVMSILLYYVVVIVERLVLPWVRQTTG